MSGFSYDGHVNVCVCKCKSICVMWGHLLRAWVPCSFQDRCDGDGFHDYIKNQASSSAAAEEYTLEMLENFEGSLNKGSLLPLEPSTC